VVIFLFLSCIYNFIVPFVVEYIYSVFFFFSLTGITFSVQSAGARIRRNNEPDGFKQQRPKTGQNRSDRVFEICGRRAEMASGGRSEGSRSRQ